MKENQRCRRYMLTINNPGEAWNHEKIREALGELKLAYWAISDEIGLKEQTPHTHVYFVARTSAIRFSTVKELFPTAHIDPAQGTSAECRAYIEKSGKWAEEEKAETSIPGTFEEWGELPKEPGQGARSDMTALYQDIHDGLNNAEIMAKNPEMAKHIGKMDKIRQDILVALYRTTWRDLEVTYIFGPTGTGKTRHVMEGNGYASVYRVTNYIHSFDLYDQEAILCLDEFRSSLPIGEMLNYLDGYPLELPARYANRVACYTKVYIVTNIPLEQQYINIQCTDNATWKAFLRRIHHVVEFRRNGKPVDHGCGLVYISKLHKTPEWVQEAELAEETATLF